MSCELLICDLDGTLIDSHEDIADALNLALVDTGLPRHTTAAVAGMIGGGLMSLVQQAIGTAVVGAELVLQRYRVHYAARLVAKTRLYAGLEEILREARARGLALAVATNKPDDFTRQILERLGILGLFAAVVGEREGRPRKPDPACVLEILAATRTAPDRALFLGDSCIDLETARAAGVPVALVSWGLTPRTVLAAAHPDHLVDTPAELAGLLAGAAAPPRAAGREPPCP